MLRTPAVALLAATTLALSSARQQAQPGATIRGRLTFADSGEPAAEITVQLVTRRRVELGAVRTDRDGAFRFTGVTPGVYMVSTQLPRSEMQYLSGVFGAEGTFEEGDVVRLHAGDDRAIAHALPRAGGIGGRVTGTAGEPVRYAIASVFAMPDDNDGTKIVSAGSAVTDSSGRFLVSGLVRGVYRLRVEPPEHQAPDENGRVWLPTYYPDRTVPSDATGVSIGAGDLFDALSITLARGVPPSVSGTVVDAGAPPVDGRDVVLGQRQSSGMTTTATMRRERADAEGRFMFRDVQAGQYGLQAFDASRSGSAPKLIDVADSSITGLLLEVLPPVHVTGRVVFEDGPRPEGPVAVRAVTAGADPETLETLSVPVSPAGRFEFDTAVARSLTVTTGSPRSWLKSVVIERRDYLNVPIDVAALSSPVTLTMGQRMARISGRVTDSDTAVVLVIADDPRTWTPGSTQLSSAEVDESGSFRIDGLPPGPYRVAVQPHTPYGFLVRDPFVLARLAAAGTPVELNAGEELLLALRANR